MNSSTQEVCISPAPVNIGQVEDPQHGQAKAGFHSTFTRDVVLFCFANLIALTCNGVLTFLLPRLLSMEGYGYYRLFLLYGGFAGVLHLGLLDGALIRWAARPQQRMRTEVFSSMIFLVLQHLVLLAPVVAILSILYRHQSWFFLTAAIVVYALVWNIATLGQFGLQADRSFGWLSALTVVNPALLLGVVLAVNHWAHLTLKLLLNAYIGSWMVAGVALWVVLLAKFPGSISSLRRVWRVGTYNIQVGWSVLLALLLTNVVLSLDRIVVSMSFSIRDFAIYSLAANALAVVNTIILSISRVVFPYLSDVSGTEVRILAYSQGEAALMALWALGLTAYFPMCVLIERLLPTYLPSLPILRLLMLTTGLTSAIYILHSTYFRSSLRQGRLLLGAIVGLLAAGMFLLLARHSGSLVKMSWAMLGAITVWWLADELLLRDLTRRSLFAIGKTVLFVAACCVSLLLSSLLTSSWSGALLYVTTVGVFTTVTYWKILHSALQASPFSFARVSWLEPRAGS